MKHVLIVDDDVNIQELLSTYLKHAGYGVILSSDGRDALKQCVVRKPDAILMDFRMPKLDGLNALDLMTLTAMGKRIPILMMSGMASPEVIETCKRLGASDFLVKPFNPDELLKKIEFFVTNGPKLQTFATPAPPTAAAPPPPRPAPTPMAPPARPAPMAEPVYATPVPDPTPPPATAVEAMVQSMELTQELPQETAPEPPAPPSATQLLNDLMMAPAPVPGPLDGLSSIDRHFATMVFESNNALQKELVMKAIDEFTHRAVARMVDIQMALREERYEDVVAEASALKEESLSLGAHQFAGLSAELEDLARKHAPEGIRKIRGMREEYVRCESDFARLKEAIENLPRS